MKPTPPRQTTFFICLALYAVAMAAHFGVIHVRYEVPTFAWIGGYGLLLAACIFKGL